uniref:Uncharacterized protein n=1 Tax=Plectus sambesii TaxID=2011161 RepID=A0A914WTK2_9BILA
MSKGKACCACNRLGGVMKRARRRRTNDRLAVRQRGARVTKAQKEATRSVGTTRQRPPTNGTTIYEGRARSLSASFLHDGRGRGKPAAPLMHVASKDQGRDGFTAVLLAPLVSGRGGRDRVNSAGPSGSWSLSLSIMRSSITAIYRLFARLLPSPFTKTACTASDTYRTSINQTASTSATHEILSPNITLNSPKFPLSKLTEGMPRAFSLFLRSPPCQF